MRKYKFFKVVVLLVLLSSCKAHDNSFKIQGEELKVSLLETAVEKASSQKQQKSLESVVGVIAKPVVKYTIGAIKKRIETEVKKYTATYRSKTKGEGYYKKDLLYNTLVFERKVKEKVALRLELDIEYLENRAFMKIKPQSLKVNYTKAKIAKRDSAKFVIQVDVIFQSAWVDKQQSPHVEKVSEVSFVFKDVMFGEEYTSFEKEESEILLAIPKNYGANGEEYKKGGFYTVEVSVTEIDQRKKVLNKVVELFGDNEEAIVDEVLQLIEKEEDDE